MTDRIEYLKRQIETAEIHGDTEHAQQCEQELRQIDKCLTCPHLIVDAIPSLNGDGYSNSYSYCTCECDNS